MTIWLDPYIASEMLKAHLDPATDAASRRPGTIDSEVTWLTSRLGLRPGDPILDLGCGPGLYCTRFAQKGMKVTGIDYSETSISHAREAAEQQCLSITYRVQDYLTLEDSGVFRAALLVYGDFCVLSDEDRAVLLERVHRALRRRGFFVFDASTPAAFQREQSRNEWEVRTGGFWRQEPHLLLKSTFVYPEDTVSLHQYGVVGEDGIVTVFRVWSRYYSPEAIAPVLDQHGFEVEEVTADLIGNAYSPDSEWLGVVARRR
jgi:SAM-dependent methyltransferase